MCVVGGSDDQGVTELCGEQVRMVAKRSRVQMLRRSISTLRQDVTDRCNPTSLRHALNELKMRVTAPADAHHTQPDGLLFLIRTEQIAHGYGCDAPRSCMEEPS